MAEPAPATEAPPQLAAVVRAEGGISEGLSVLLDVNGEKQSFAVVKKNQRVKVSSAFCALDPLIGVPFGSVFEVRNGARGEQHLVRLTTPNTREGLPATDEDALQRSESEGRDNRQLNDDNSAQGLSADEIESMKRQGATGEEIIRALTENSATFANKTAFSQEKYMRKKQKKYAPRVIVRRPSARSVCEAYFLKTPMKTGFLRVDSLALLLSMANVGAGADVLILDTCGGLPTAAVAERVGGHGTICSAYRGQHPPSIDILRLLNLDSASAAAVTRASISALAAGRAAVLRSDGGGDIGPAAGAAARAEQADVADLGGTGVRQGSGRNACREPRQGEAGEVVQETQGLELRRGNLDATLNDEVTPVEKPPSKLEGGLTAMDIDAVGENGSGTGTEPKQADQSPGRRKRRNVGEEVMEMRAGRPAPPEYLQRWAQNGFSSLVMAAPSISPSAAVQLLLPLLAPSSSFAIYHTYLQDAESEKWGRLEQPLAECMQFLQKEKSAVSLQLSEPWLREYQVLPDRSHPFMQMSATGGYLLHGITVDANNRSDGA